MMVSSFVVLVSLGYFGLEEEDVNGNFAYNEKQAFFGVLRRSALILLAWSKDRKMARTGLSYHKMVLKFNLRLLSNLIDCLDDKTVADMINFSFAVWDWCLLLNFKVETYLSHKTQWRRNGLIITIISTNNRPSSWLNVANQTKSKTQL